MEEQESLYEILGVERTASAGIIKKAYFKQALVCHPDKCPDDPTATERFQRVSRAHAVLSDPERRRLYDETGIVDDAEDGPSSEAEAHWTEHWRCMFPEVTVEAIEEFSRSYRGSAEEREHVLAAYSKLGRGDSNGGGADKQEPASIDGSVWHEVVDQVMLAADEDIPRFKDMVEQAILAGEIKRHSKPKNGDLAAKKKKKQQRQRQAEKEAAEAEELMQEILAKKRAKMGGAVVGEGEDTLTALIRANKDSQQNRFDSMIAGLEAKYASTSTTKSKKKKKKKPQGGGNK